MKYHEAILLILFVVALVFASLGIMANQFIQQGLAR